MNKRYTIGFLSDVFLGDYNYTLWRGIIDRTENRDINLICFSLTPSLLDEKKEYIRKYIVKVISKKNVDGLILCSGVLVQILGYEEIQHISKNLFSFPVVNIGVSFKSIPCIMTDNYSGIYKTVNHLIISHKYKRIAYIRGPKDNFEETERFRAYKSSLEFNNIVFNRDYITGHYPWSREKNGAQVIKELNEKCCLKVDAIVCSNDNLALNVIDELNRIGKSVPEDIAVTGFDNISFAAQLKYLLTTCTNPTYRMGIKAVDILLNLMKGRTGFKNKIQIPSELIVRHSCGCFPVFYRESIDSFHTKAFEKLEEKPDIKVITYYIKKKMLNQIQGIDERIFTSSLFDKTISTLIEDITSDSSHFIPILKQFIMYYIKGKDKSINNIRILMDEIYTIVKNLSLNPEQLIKLEHLFGNVWKIIGYTGELIQIDNRSVTVKQSHDLFWVNMDITSILDLEKMLEILTIRLPQIGIERFFLVLYDEKDSTIAHLTMGYDETGDILTQIKGKTFQASDLLPEGIFSLNHSFSLLVEPLHIRGRHLGFVVMDTKRQEDFVYFSISLQISTFLKGVVVLKQLRRTMGNIIDTLVATVEARDPYTAGHQKRVSDLARQIAKEMDLSPERIDTIRMAAQIHDIGKIAIPSEILSKPSKLTQIEYDFIKTHPQNGYDILKNIDFPGPVAEIVLQHHEKINGSGYPKGLFGNKILLESKIITVSDIVEAMSSHRPYRPKLGIDPALAEIEKNKGIFYDPDIVDICVKLFKEKNFKFKQAH